MDNEKEELTLINALHGGVLEQFGDALRELVRNVLDPNTDAKAKRSVTLRCTVSPSDDRDFGAVDFSVVPSLAPPKAQTTRVSITYDGLMFEHAKQQPLPFASVVVDIKGASK
jgi:hypothetical protein